MGDCSNGGYLTFKLVCRLSPTWRLINNINQLTLLLAGHRYTDGKICINHTMQEDIAA